MLSWLEHATLCLWLVDTDSRDGMIEYVEYALPSDLRNWFSDLRSMLARALGVGLEIFSIRRIGCLTFCSPQRTKCRSSRLGVERNLECLQFHRLQEQTHSEGLISDADLMTL